ncbi:unnamed protein product [Rotaria sp. Silwood1]|nr:unnamed protein product [Rotaria sp. Silwood1]CAF0940508.1 unnamed protein product [Rotaria sp. Silwood1]CAF3397142.1 unnamed protein product [Rotaria sp. Silwood1]CAF4634277.1 unnamed protein product [Rotaria sp. Silwood1]
MPVSIVIFLQILFVLILIIHGEDTFDCTGYEDDSYHPIYDADDCRRYWHCIYVNTVYMHAVKRVCPAGTEFDATLRKCETSSLVDCKPSKSPHMPRTTSTTKAWKWKYSRLFSQKYWKTTIPFFMTTRKHRIFDLGDSFENDITTMIMPESETTEQLQVLPFTHYQLTTGFSFGQLSKDIHVLLSKRRPYKNKLAVAKLFQPGEPENEAIAYTSTIKQRTRRTRYSTQSTSIDITTQLPLTTLFITAEATMRTTMSTTSTTFTATTTRATTITSSFTSTLITTIITQPDSTININPQFRIGGQSRRNNMTLYILTSDEHKIRRFSINHTRGFLINCNQLRRRLLGRRRLRDIFQTTIATTNHAPIIKNSSTSSIQIFHHNILSLTMLSFFFLQK